MVGCQLRFGDQYYLSLLLGSSLSCAVVSLLRFGFSCSYTTCLISPWTSLANYRLYAMETGPSVGFCHLPCKYCNVGPETFLRISTPKDCASAELQFPKRTVDFLLKVYRKKLFGQSRLSMLHYRPRISVNDEKEYLPAFKCQS
jgi:hypothetical protein